MVRLIVETIPATAGNVVTNIIPRGRHVRRLLYGEITLVAGGGAANRTIQITIDNGAGVIYVYLPENSVAITAGQTGAIDYVPAYEIALMAPPNTRMCAIGSTLIFNSDMRMRVTIAGGLAADSYSGRLVFEEWCP